MLEVDQLVNYSREWGAKPLYVQGPGGNFSFKNSDYMWIKSSGSLLKEVSTSSGITKTNFKLAREFNYGDLKDLPLEKEEIAYAELIGEMKIRGERLRPSMESAFHAVIEHSWVFHTHSAGMILLASDGEDRLQQLARHFPQVKFLFIEACLPGLELSRKIMLKQNLFPSNDSNICMVLENHGVVWAGNSVSELSKDMQTVENYLEETYGLSGFQLPIIEEGRISFSNWLNFSFSEEAIFPDYALFFGKSKGNELVGEDLHFHEELASDKYSDAVEICFLQAILSTKMSELGTLKVLTTEIQEKIVNMEVEKLRLKQINGEGS